MKYSVYHLFAGVLFCVLGINTVYAMDTRGVAYDGVEARRVQSVLVGVVEDVREVVIDESSGLSQTTGTGIGAVVGGLLGNEIGGGSGNTAATLLLGILGGVVGNHMEKSVNTARGLEFIVTLTNGNTIAVTQAIDDDGRAIAPGDRVRIVDGQYTRVVKLRHTARAARESYEAQ